MCLFSCLPHVCNCPEERAKPTGVEAIGNCEAPDQGMGTKRGPLLEQSML